MKFLFLLLLIPLFAEAQYTAGNYALGNISTYTSALVGRTATGTITGNSKLTIDTTGMGAVLLYYTISAVGGNIYFEKQVVTTWMPVNCFKLDDSDGVLWSYTTPDNGNAGTYGQYRCPVEGAKSFRMRASSLTGTATIEMGTSQGVPVIDGHYGFLFTKAKIQDTNGNDIDATGGAVKSYVVGTGNPCTSPTATLVSITGATSGTNAAQIIALSGSTKIYVCSLSVLGVSGTTPTFSLVQGTGSNCATGQTVVLQAFGTTAAQFYPFPSPVAVGGAGKALCYLDTGTNPVQNYHLTYVQQ